MRVRMDPWKNQTAIQLSRHAPVNLPKDIHLHLGYKGPCFWTTSLQSQTLAHRHTAQPDTQEIAAT